MVQFKSIAGFLEGGAFGPCIEGRFISSICCHVRWYWSRRMCSIMMKEWRDAARVERGNEKLLCVKCSQIHNHQKL